ncbi:hypothetical protein RclHR1_04140012 [Rhizophagus clarus]|uniref:Cytochrome P450 n=1 Tax=Rhizophagus clarus TaxID=94130 RepID=A0A2Z6S9Q2_9GLOM|nr:hypothetical protein RclHR1_04140012 [Rhizophagus clarus]
MSRSQFYYHYFTRPNRLPGPFPLPILGNAHQQIGYGFNDWLISLHKKYGDMYELTLAGRRLIVLCKPDLIENMNIPSSKNKYFFRTHNAVGFAEYGFDGKGIIFNNDYESWRYNRQFFTQALMNPSFNHQAIEWTNELCNEMESYWNNLEEDHELDLLKWMQNEKLKESNNFVESIEIYMGGIIYFYVFNKFIRQNFPFIREKVRKLLKNKDYLVDKLYTIVKKRRIEIENTPLDQPLRHDMLTAFITANTPRDINVAKNADDDLSKPMTDKEIFRNILDAMSAGTDATANLICFVVYYLEHYPEVKQRMRQEFETVLGNDLTKHITHNDLDELEYCDAVGELNWPKGTAFQMLLSVIMKDKNYWTEPEKFDPDRFYKIEENNEYSLEKENMTNTFHMFGGGIRICPGKKLAIIEIKC